MSFGVEEPNSLDTMLFLKIFQIDYSSIKSKISSTLHSKTFAISIANFKDGLYFSFSKYLVVFYIIKAPAEIFADALMFIYFFKNITSIATFRLTVEFARKSATSLRIAEL